MDNPRTTQFLKAELKAIYTNGSWSTIQGSSSSSSFADTAAAPLSATEQRVVDAARRRAFDSNSSFMTTCDYGEGLAPQPQRWKFVSAPSGNTQIQSSDGSACLSSAGPAVVACSACKAAECEWDTRSGYSGENGNRGKANETTAQIKSAVDGSCLKFSAASRGGKGTCAWARVSESNQ